MNRAIACALGMTSLIFVLGSCTENSVTRKPDSSTTDLSSKEPSFSGDWEKRRWIAKVAKTLRYGQVLGPKESIEELEKMTAKELAAHFMKSPEFGNTLLDFNLFFLGFRPDNLRAPTGRFVDTAFRYPAAVTAAQEVLKDGDYFKFLSETQPAYGAPLGPPVIEDPSDKDLSETALRQKYFDRFVNLLDQGIMWAEKGLPQYRREFCQATIRNRPNIYEALINAGLTTNMSYYLTFYQPNRLMHATYVYCANGATLDDGEVLAEMKMIRSKAPAMIELLKKLVPSEYNVKTVADIKPFDVSLFGDADKTTLFSPIWWSFLPNNSTNMNRKRGSYILKHYFCDDLTPINVVVPGDHAGGDHGKEASCYSCHYKLDPMSGFFRENGRWGINFSKRKDIGFEDGVRTDREAYLEQWKEPKGSARTWNVGYIRSSEYPDRNIYAENLSDLFAILREAPEVKRCIVKRLHQYLVGPDQVVEPGYFEYLSDRFIERAKTNSSMALKEAMVDILTSRVFTHPNPKTNECYDYAPGTDPTQRPPCQVAYLMEKNCASCHSSSGASGGLDVTRWIKLADGTFNFPHTSSDGTQYPLKHTLGQIENRMTSDDMSLRMPYNRYISSADREQIVIWASTGGGK